MILSFKLFITPLLIGLVTLAGRRWGPVVNGLLIGLPLISGPISFILAHEFGLEFTAKAAAGNLAGQVSFCIFCLAYSLIAQKRNWLISAFSAVIAFLFVTFILNNFSWLLLPAFITLLIAIALAARIIPRHFLSANGFIPPRWDLPARMIVGTIFVILITAFTNILGSQLSGLLSPFPVYGVVFASFTHAQQGANATSHLLRGMVLGSVSNAFFYLIVGGCLTSLGITLTYIMASFAAVLVSGVLYFITRRDKRQAAYG